MLNQGGASFKRIGEFAPGLSVKRGRYSMLTEEPPCVIYKNSRYYVLHTARTISGLRGQEGQMNYTEIDLNTSNINQSEGNGSETQLATAYIVYMMLGSYFKSCKAQSALKVNSLYVHYTEMRVNTQLSTERRIERDFTEQFAEFLPLFENSLCEVSIYDSGDNLCLRFDTGFEKLIAMVDREGQYEFILKEN